MIDTNTIVPMELDPEFSTSNFFCNGMTNNKSNKFILLFYNFDDEYFYTNKEIGMYIEDLLNMKKKYTFGRGNTSC